MHLTIGKNYDHLTMKKGNFGKFGASGRATRETSMVHRHTNNKESITIV